MGFMAQLGIFIALLELQQHRRDEEGAGQTFPGTATWPKRFQRRHVSKIWAGCEGLPPASSQAPVVAPDTFGGSGHPTARPQGCSAGLRACRCMHPQRHKALSLWQSDGVINFRTIVLQWQALIYSPGNSFWFKVHIRCVNAP